jgi:hypothetical protein
VAQLKEDVMASNELIRTLREQSGLDDDAVHTWLRLTLAVVGSAVPSDDANAAAMDLGQPCAGWLVAESYVGPMSLDALYRLVAERRGQPLGIAMEQTQMLCRALVAALDGPSAANLARHLPQELFRPSLSEQSIDPPSRTQGHGHTLATGRPGSANTLSTAAPPSAVQSDSVASSGNPHGGRKLSSGQPQVESVAEGRTGSKHPLSDSHSE